MLRCLSCLFVLVALCQTARAGDVVVTGSLEGQGTTWDTDGAGYSALAIDYRRRPWSLSLLTKLGYGSVDERVLEYLDLGGRLWHRAGRAHLYARLGLFHQHEIPREAISAGLSTILGVGDGIRHRAGTSLGAGVLIELVDYKYGSIFGSIHTSAAYALENEKGPSWYWGGGLGLGFTYDLSTRPLRL